MSVRNVCPVCSSTDVSLFFEIMNVPVHIGFLWASQDSAQHCPKGDIKLAFCHSCGFITNLAFDADCLEYTQAYDNSLHFSPCYQDYVRSEASRLIKRYNLYEKDIIEIGCGKGDFLLLLCKLGNNRGLGFDPSYDSKCADREVVKRITFIRDFYSERYASYQADFICCRYVFEHIQKPSDFLLMLRRMIGNRLNTVVYFEVPSALFILRDFSIWDIIYEHCSYFTLESLARVFTFCGFDICNLTGLYKGQFLGIEALPSQGVADSASDQQYDIRKLAHYVNAFADNYQNKVDYWQRKLNRIGHTGQRVVVWSAGAKGVSFLNMLNIQSPVEYVVDVNPHKEGMYMAGTGQQIVSPEFLKKYKPNAVIVMNPIYKKEIQQIVKNIGLKTEFLYV